MQRKGTRSKQREEGKRTTVQYNAAQQTASASKSRSAGTLPSTTTAFAVFEPATQRIAEGDIASKSVISLLPLAFLLSMILYIYPHYVDLYILLHVSLFNCTKFKDETDYSGND